VDTRVLIVTNPPKNRGGKFCVVEMTVGA
jgi:hypothetical protein